MIDYLEAADEGEPGSPMPFWLRFSETVDRPREQMIKRLVNDAIGQGSKLPLPRDVVTWGYKFVDGYLVLMFYTAEDRDIARLAI